MDPNSFSSSSSSEPSESTSKETGSTIAPPSSLSSTSPSSVRSPPLSPPPSAQKRQPTPSASAATAEVTLSKFSLGKRRAREDDGEGGPEEDDEGGVGEGGEGDGTTSSTPKRVRFAQYPLAVVLGRDTYLQSDGMEEGRDGVGDGKDVVDEGEPASSHSDTSSIAPSSSSSTSAPIDQAQQPSSSTSSSSTFSQPNLVTQATQTSPSLLPVPLPAEFDQLNPPSLSAAERLRADQLAVASRHDHSDPSLWTRSTEYWKEDGNVVFLHGNTLFKFHRSTLTEESDIFRSLFLLPPAAQDGVLPQGVSEENPIRWSGPAQELEVILWARYKPQLLIPLSPPLLPRFLSLLKAANFPSLRTWSLSLLQPLISQRAYPSPIWLLKAGLDCQRKEWVYQACEELIVEGKPSGEGGGSWREMQEELMELGRRAGEEGERELERGAVGWLGRVFEEREASHFRAIDFYRMVPKLQRHELCQKQKKKGKCKRDWSETWHNAVRAMCWKGRRVEDLRAQDFKASLSPLTLLKRMLPTVDDSDSPAIPQIEGQCDHCMQLLRDVLKKKWADEKALLRKRFVDDLDFDGDGPGGGGGRDVVMG